MDGKASLNTLHYSVARCNTDKVGKTLTDVFGASLVAKTVGKTLCRLPLVDTFSDTLSEVVAKTIVIAIACVKVEAPVKTDVDINAELEAYTDVDTSNEFEAVAVDHLKAYTFS